MADRNHQTLPEREFEVSLNEEEDKAAKNKAFLEGIIYFKNRIIRTIRPPKAELEEGEINPSSSEPTESNEEMQPQEVEETSAIDQTDAIPATLEAPVQIVKEVRVSRFSDYPPAILAPIK